MKKWIELVIILLCLWGEGRCLYKMITCNWEPIGKSEIIYTVAFFTGAGVVVGYFNIKDK